MYVLKVLGILIIFLVITLGLGYLSFKTYEFYAPRYTAVDNKVFHESAQYNDGMLRDLEKLQMDYLQANAEQKIALKAVVLHRFSIYPEDRMPPNLHNFYNQMKGGSF